MARYRKGLYFVILTMVVLSGAACFPGRTVNAASGSSELSKQAETEQCRTGLLENEIVEFTVTDAALLHGQDVSEDEANTDSVNGDSANGDSPFADLKSAQIYTTEWDKYKTYYFYNQMTDEQREFYDELDEICSGYLLTTADANEEVISGMTCYYTDMLTSTDLGLYDMVDLITVFRVNNPQYYFLSNYIYPFSYGGQYYIAPGVYSAFVDGNSRAEATAAVKEQADAWEAEAEACATDAEKVLLLHDLIIDKVDYNETIYTMSFNEDTQYTQSAYSVFCMDVTVCAGYSQAFAMMCNACGVDAVVVTSDDHEWNKVRIEDSWYNVDLTWADQEAVTYQFFERSDSYYDTVSDGNSAYHHAEEALWSGLLPSCTLDTEQDGDYTKPGTLPAITQTTASPTATVTFSGSKYKIKFSDTTQGAEIYYTLDGSTPSAASTKCRKYTGTIKTSTLPVIRIMAVCDGYYDSSVAGVAIITYKGNDADSGTMDIQVCMTGSNVTLSANGFTKKQYSFTGWNTKAKGTGKAYGKKQTITGISKNLTLYAQWTPKSYEITYVLNGGKNSSGNPASYTAQKAVKLENPTRKGYTFVGWYTNKKLTKKITKIAKGSTGKMTLYAKWKKKTYTITYRLNGGTNSSKNPTSYSVTTSTVKLKNPTRAGYQFMGWYSDKKCTKRVTKIKKGSTGAVTLYAKWKKQ